MVLPKTSTTSLNKIVTKPVASTLNAGSSSHGRCPRIQLISQEASLLAKVFLACQRQPGGEGRPALEFARYLQRAAVCLDDDFADGQTKAGVARAGA